MTAVSIIVPATTANLGPGFDCIGAALTLYNEFEFALLPAGEPLQIEVAGLEADRVARDASNLAYQSFVRLYEQIGEAVPSVRIAIDLRVPLARGLGSSATAIVAGLLGANMLAGSPLSPEAVMKLAIAIEGHPDNVVPALIGGCQLAASAESDWAICAIDWHPDIVPIVASPNFELSTAEARSVLPQTYSRTDAIFNVAHLGLLLRGLETGRTDWLKVALQDRIHQPYRKALIRGYDAIEQAALAAGACGLVISGAGPTVLALATDDRAASVAAAMRDTWQTMGVQPQVQIATIDSEGARVSTG